ncbi:uncharacterized protein C10orf67 homolog, mitochondrial [Esox lucius]|uniref:uncharacterized protein C10orf67 homolog, mitochondrial n=1 Tax=Esox lucius TaxID=8010 RepID=UPI0014771C2E|nr:uncharacterized protein C10orf67 homolog, mitochondrial [Esox lucius]
MDILKKDIALKMKFIQAHYESRLQQEAESLFTRINDKVKCLENLHKEKINVLRRSFRQQFSNAIHVVGASCKNYYLKKEENVLTVATDTERWKDLMNEIQEKNFKIECMSEQLRGFEERVLTTISSEDAEDPEKEWLREENKKLKEDVDSMHIVMEQVCNSLDAKEQQLEDLAHNLTDVKAKLEIEKKALRKMTSDYEHVKAQLSVENDSTKKKMDLLKQGLVKEIQNIEDLRKSEKHAVEEGVVAPLTPDKEKQEKKVWTTQEAVLKTRTAKKQTGVVEAGGELIQHLHELKRVETVQKKQIERLQKQLFRSNGIWEKKFEILKASFHAIKDEMFLRQTLQRQAASLQHASVSYTSILRKTGKMNAGWCQCPNATLMDSPGSYQRPVYNGFKRPTSFATGTPLPGIGTGVSQKPERTTKAMNIGGLSGRETDGSEFQRMCGEDSKQAGEDGEQGDEEELQEILPLPPPPSRIRQTASLTAAICNPSK